MAQLVPLLVEQLPANELCLEIGIGTGRIALPLVEAGVRMVGVDISAEMLRKLVERRPASHPEVVVADATRLPFADATFGSAIASHVLHLIPTWRDALAEIWRVVRPNGFFAASRGARLDAWREQVIGQFFRKAGDPLWPPGMDRMDELDAEMAGRGARVEPFRELSSEDTTSIDEVIGAMQEGIWAACWSLDDATRRRAGSATRTWAAIELGDLAAPRPVRNASLWRPYRLPE